MSNDAYPKVYLYKRIVQAKLYMDQNYASEIELDNIADEAFFSKFHFLRLFKNVYGKTPHQYLLAVRMEKAKDLLKQGVPVAEVCYSVGLASAGSFSSAFKRFSGYAPSRYQEMQLQREEEVEAVPLKFVPNCFAAANGWVESQF